MTSFFNQLKAIAFLSALALSQPAAANLSALISIHEGGSDMWEQRGRIQDLLEKKFGFDRVRFLVDATPAEIPARMQTFLETPAQQDDRRFVWVSGFNRYEDSSVCADTKFQTIKPSATSFILAPSCYTDIISLPQGTRHFSLTTPTPITQAARLGRTHANTAPWIAVLALPSSNEPIIQGTNSLIFDYLNTAQNNQMDPAALLHHLRVRFRWNGSNFTPQLDLFDRGIQRTHLRPFGIRHSQSSNHASFGGLPTRARKSQLALYSKPYGLDGLTIATQNKPVRILRRDHDGDMRFVAIGSSFFGWVKSNDLVN